jgi:hypothetical protein
LIGLRGTGSSEANNSPFHVKSMGKQTKKSIRVAAWNWLLRFIKFHIVGFGVFLVGTVIFVLAFSSFGEWTWVISSGSGGVLQFFLISYLNTTKKAKIFEISKQKSE